jgi:HD-GYP domain-containing protein (c-di-GMP phosphodiesterase class II)
MMRAEKEFYDGIIERKEELERILAEKEKEVRKQGERILEYDARLDSRDSKIKQLLENVKGLNESFNEAKTRKEELEQKLVEVEKKLEPYVEHARNITNVINTLHKEADAILETAIGYEKDKIEELQEAGVGEENLKYLEQSVELLQKASDAADLDVKFRCILRDLMIGIKYRPAALKQMLKQAKSLESLKRESQRLAKEGVEYEIIIHGIKPVAEKILRQAIKEKESQLEKEFDRTGAENGNRRKEIIDKMNALSHALYKSEQGEMINVAMGLWEEESALRKRISAERGDLAEGLVESERQVRLLTSVVDALNKGGLEEACEKIANEMAVDSCHLSLHVGSGLMYVAGAHSSSIPKESRRDKRAIEDFINRHATEALRSGAVVNIDKIMENPPEKIYSELHKPLKIGGQVMGVLSLLNNKDEHGDDYTYTSFKDADEKALVPVEQILSAALELNLYREQKKIRTRMRSLPLDLARSKAELKDEKADIAAQFISLKGLDKIVELSPEQKIRIFNKWAERMYKCVDMYGGTKDTTLQNNIVAFYGAPVHFYPVINARRAVLAGLAMYNEMIEFNNFLRKAFPNIFKEGEGLDMTMGVDVGEATVGLVGAKEKFDYHAFGEVIGRTARAASVKEKPNPDPNGFYLTGNTFEHVDDLITIDEIAKDVIYKCTGKSDHQDLSIIPENSKLALMYEGLQEHFNDAERKVKKLLGEQLTVSEREEQSPEYNGYTKNVTILSLAIASEMNLSQQSIEDLKYACALHDISMWTPDFLSKSFEKMSDEEFKQRIENHPTEAANIVRNLDFDSSETVARIVEAHHRDYQEITTQKESFGGYPDTLSRQQIPIEARIIVVADSYMAMVSKRDYRREENMSPKEAIGVIRKYMGTRYLPAVVEAFRSVIEPQKPAKPSNIPVPPPQMPPPVPKKS